MNVTLKCGMDFTKWILDLNEGFWSGLDWTTDRKLWAAISAMTCVHCRLHFGL